ncbi:MAG: tetratricopeptide repeat protein [bacterium]|nr:tetratricopeptide repeat protein [bacterium]
MRTIILTVFCGLLFIASAATADSIPIYLQKGGKGLLDKDYYKALENYTHALRLDPENFMALRNIGVAYEGINEHELAQQHFEMAYRIDSMDADLNNNLGAMYSNKNESFKAIRHFEIAFKSDSTKPMYALHLGQEYARVGELGKALPMLHRARLLNPGHPIIYFAIANCHAEAGALDSAEYYYLESQRLGAKDWESSYFLGSVRMRQGKYEEAIPEFTTALGRKPDCTDCLQSRALAYLKSGDYNEAASQFKQVVEADSANIGAWIGLGASYSLAGSAKSADSILFGLYVVDSSLGYEMLRVISSEHKRQKELSKESPK